MFFNKQLLSVSLALTALLAPPVAAQEMGPFDCVMDPNLVVEIGAPIPGVLAEVGVAQGDVVAAGQPIARLNSDVEMSTMALLELRADSKVEIEAQRAQVELIQAQQDRIMTLVERNVASPDQLERVNAELVTARALLAQAELEQEVAALELARARIQMEQRTIKSPIAGVVQHRHKSAGEYIAANGAIVTLAQLDPLKVEAFLPVDVFPMLQTGMTARLTPAPPFEQEQPAIIAAIDQIFDAASGTFAVHLELQNPDMALPAGHRCLVSFASDAG